jgi:hypothetical protein
MSRRAKTFLRAAELRRGIFAERRGFLGSFVNGAISAAKLFCGPKADSFGNLLIAA